MSDISFEHFTIPDIKTFVKQPYSFASPNIAANFYHDLISRLLASRGIKDDSRISINILPVVEEDRSYLYIQILYDLQIVTYCDIEDCESKDFDEQLQWIEHAVNSFIDYYKHVSKPGIPVFYHTVNELVLFPYLKFEFGIDVDLIPPVKLREYIKTLEEAATSAFDQLGVTEGIIEDFTPIIINQRDNTIRKKNIIFSALYEYFSRTSSSSEEDLVKDYNPEEYNEYLTLIPK